MTNLDELIFVIRENTQFSWNITFSIHKKQHSADGL
jgi:hypothetical protein